jgi:hypothetical protein
MIAKIELVLGGSAGVRNRAVAYGIGLVAVHLAQRARLIVLVMA